MRWLHAAGLRIRSILRPGHVDQELNEELQFHLDHLTEEHIAQGMTLAEARLAALRAMGGVEQFKEECRDMRGVQFLATLRQDLRYGLRQLRSHPGFTTVAVLTLALGIGATSAIFSVTDAVLLQALPYRHPDHLVVLQERIRKISPDLMKVSAPDIAVIQHTTHVFANIAAFQNERFNLTGSGDPERVRAARVSASLWPMLGASPRLGRVLTTEEDRPGHAVTILSYELWQSRFGGASNVLGKTLKLDGRPYTIVGVMPQEFAFPPRGMPQYESAQLWIPVAFTPEELSDVGDNFDIGVLAQLKPGVTLAQVRSDLGVAAAAIQRTYGPVALSMGLKLEVAATPFRQAVVGNIRLLVYLLLAAVGFLLLIACANVAGLLLSRSAARQKEIAVRLALGAGPRRILRQLLTESVLLALVGGLLGLLLSFLFTRLLAALAPATIPQAQKIGVNGTVAGFALLVSLAVGILFGIAPAFATLRQGIHVPLQEGGRNENAGGSSSSARNSFVIAQVAIAVVLAAGAGLLIRSLVRAEQTSPGLRPEHVVTATLALPVRQYPGATQITGFFRQLFQSMQTAPGSAAIGAATDLPTESNWNHVYTIEDHPTPATAALPLCAHTLVLGHYFQAMGIPLLRGRLFSPEEESGQAQVVLVSAGMAWRAWPGENPIGKRLKWGPPQSHSPWLTVVGVVGDVKQDALDRPTEAHTYAPYLQACGGQAANGMCHSLNAALRTGLPAPAAVADLRAAVQKIDPAQPLTRVRTMNAVLANSLVPRQFNTFLLAVFAGAALLLAGIGLYGLLAFRVTQQRHEIGVRLALGAQPSAVLRMIAGHGLRLTLIGAAIGCAGALALTRFLTSLLYGTPPTDPWTFFIVVLVLTLVAVLASIVPALRATRVNPMTALRCE